MFYRVGILSVVMNALTCGNRKVYKKHFPLYDGVFFISCKSFYLSDTIELVYVNYS